MLHRIHSAGESTSPQFVIYRTRGIYGWAPVESLLGPNWAAPPSCGTNAETGGPNYLVYGATNTAQNCQAFNFFEPTYPRLLKDCKACHGSDPGYGKGTSRIRPRP